MGTMSKTIKQADKKSYIQFLKDSLDIPTKELKINEYMSFLIFQIGAEPYYIKVIS